MSKFLDQRTTKSKEVVEKSIKNESNSKNNNNYYYLISLEIEYLGGKLD